MELLFVKIKSTVFKQEIFSENHENIEKAGELKVKQAMNINSCMF
jgi:hypothetical protein